jgi:hypothetical protein
MEIIFAKNPVYSSADGSSIDLIVTFDTIGEVPYTASSNDTEPVSLELYAKAAAGNYGSVGQYISRPVPAAPTITELQAQLAALSAQIAAFTPAQ